MFTVHPGRPAGSAPSGATGRLRRTICIRCVKTPINYRLRPEPTTDTENYPFINDGDSSARVVAVGPLHITSDEPGRFRLFVDGERIVAMPITTCSMFHRRYRKAAETRMGYNEVTFLSDRVCGICGFAHSVAYTTSGQNTWALLCRDALVLSARCYWK